MTRARDIVIAGAGIGGLTTALALTAQGFRVNILEQSEVLEEAGAGVQLSPNAMRILIDIGLRDILAPTAIAPDAVLVRRARTGRPIVTMPLGRVVEQAYGAPYWMMRRADLQAGLLAAVAAEPEITLTLGAKVEDYASDGRGIAVKLRRGADLAEQRAAALIGADGLWSTLRQRIGNRDRPQFRRRTAWRSLIPADELAPPLRAKVVQLWLGHDAHLVHYPVAGGKQINIVAIARDVREEIGWNGQGGREDLLARFSPVAWCAAARDLLNVPAAWSTWRLYDLPPLRRWVDGAVTLVGDAAHPMLPFLAQGAGMAIEDAAVLAGCMAQSPADLPAAFRSYEAARAQRVGKVQAAARRNGEVYHLAGMQAALRDLAMRTIGGPALIRRYRWIYGWRVPASAAKYAGRRLRNEVAPDCGEERTTMTDGQARAGQAAAAPPDGAAADRSR